MRTFAQKHEDWFFKGSEPDESFECARCQEHFPDGVANDDPNWPLCEKCNKEEIAEDKEKEDDE